MEALNMSRPVKWILGIVGGLIMLAVLLIATVYIVTTMRMNRTWDVQPTAITITEDSAAIARGEHIATIRGCRACHGENLGGAVFIDAPAFVRLYATNLTTGEGGVGANYDVVDWLRAVRNGVGPDGRGLLFMPSQDFAVIGDQDMADLIAYLRTLPAVDKLPAFENSVGPVGRSLYLAGILPLVPAERIEHRTGPITAPEPGPTVAYGEYLATVCRGCHQADFSGGPMPGTPPEAPPAANLTPHETGLAAWTESDFFTAIRTGVRRDGRLMDPENMPWPVIAQMTDEELRAVWAYLQSLPPLPMGE
jgi:mono/diheme cytochrome c family protein